MRAHLLFLINLLLLCCEGVSAQSSIEISAPTPYRLQTLVKGIQVGGVAIGDTGDVYVTDNRRSRIHRIDKSGNATVFAGVGSPEIELYVHFKGARPRHFSGDGGSALVAEFDYPMGIVADSKGNVYVSDTFNNRIRRISASGIIHTIAGTGTGGFSGDGGPASRARFATPMGLAMDADGNLFVADYGNSRIRRIDTRGNVSTVAGNGKRGDSGDGGPAIKARLSTPLGVFIDKARNLYITNLTHDKVRRVDSSGVIHAVVGIEMALVAGAMSRMLLPSDTSAFIDGEVLVAVAAPESAAFRVFWNGKSVSLAQSATYVAADGRIFLNDSDFRVMLPK